MEQKILTERQHAVLDFFAVTPLAKRFYFSGGTALAEFYLQHRFSDDLDFFTGYDVDISIVRPCVERLGAELGAQKIEYNKTHDRHLFFLKFNGEDLKLEFTKYPFPALDKRKRQNGFVIDSFRDLSANKLMALLDRFDPKDFADIYFILRNRKLALVRADVQKKFGTELDTLFLAAEFSKIRRVEVLPRMIKPLTIKQLKDFFEDQIRELRVVE